jgi:two-component system sensor histidine kinase TctE
MRTPLAILRTHLAVLKKQPHHSEAGRASLADIEIATERLQSLLTGLVTLARNEDVHPAAPRTPIDLAEVARAVAREQAPMAAKARVHLQLDAPEGPIAAAADPLLISELLANLIDNAVRYNRRGGQVVVSVREADGAPILEIADDGPGVPPEDRDRIFQRFYRLPRDHARAGSGLGLSIVQAIAERLEARLSISEGLRGRGLSVRAVFAASPQG